LSPDRPENSALLSPSPGALATDRPEDSALLSPPPGALATDWPGDSALLSPPPAALGTDWPEDSALLSPPPPAVPATGRPEHSALVSAAAPMPPPRPQDSVKVARGDFLPNSIQTPEKAPSLTVQPPADAVGPVDKTAARSPAMRPAEHPIHMRPHVSSGRRG